MAIKKISANLLGSNAVLAANIAGGAISAADIANNSITAAKLSASTSPTFGGLTVTGDINFGDNDKAVFGAGSDLQIYHDGSNSYVNESGTGNLYLQGTNHVYLTNSDGSKTYFAGNSPTGWVKLYYDNSVKLETTSTGIDVTGTVTADSLTVDTSTLVVDSTNNRVGIGTTSLNADLHIGSASATGDTTNPALQIGGATTYRLGMYTSTEGAVIENKNGDDGIQFRVKTAGEAMRIDGGTGNVGIGTSSPDVTLDVVGNARFDSVAGNALRLDRVTSGNNIDIDFHNPIGTAGVIAKIRVDGDGLSNLFGALSFHTGTTPDSPSEAMRIDRLGNVGIGTTSPARNLSVVDASAPHIQLAISADQAASNGFEIAFDGSANYIVGRENVPTLFYTNNTEHMRITSSGDVSIGSDHAGFTGYRVLNLRGGSTGGIYNLENSSGTRTASLLNTGSDLRLQTFVSGGAILFEPEGTERVRIDSSGNLLVNTTSTLATAHQTIACTAGSGSKIPLALQVGLTSDGYTCVSLENQAGQQGTIVVNTSSVAYNTSSDARLKDVTGEARGLEVINQLNPVAYNWKADGKADEGLIAQEVKEIVPNAVSGSEEEMYQMDYSKLVVHLVKGMKEQQAQIEALQSEINLLKGE